MQLGVLNYNGNDGTVTRFGWKAQNKSLLIFSGEAYNVEMGISNLLFNAQRDETPNCSPVPSPNSVFNLSGKIDEAVFDDINGFANFMRFLAAPVPGRRTARCCGDKAISSTSGARCATPPRCRRAQVRLPRWQTRRSTPTQITRSTVWGRAWPTR